MMAVPMEIDGYPLLHFPNVCTNEPSPNAVFCEEHLLILQRHNIPTDKKAFLEYTGCKGNFCNVYIYNAFGYIPKV